MKFYTVTYVPKNGIVKLVTVAAGGIQEARSRLIAAGVPVTKATSVVTRAYPPEIWTRERVAAIRAAMDFSKLELAEVSMFEAMLSKYEGKAEAMLSKYEGKAEEAADDGEE